MSLCARRILVVDDDAFVRRPLEFILRGEGYDAVTAEDGDACMASVAACVPDLIFLDVMMPGRDGFDVCRDLKGDPTTADIPVILLSARGREHDRERGLALGACEFLTKPYSPSDVLRRVKEILDSRAGSGEPVEGGRTDGHG